MKHLFTLLVGFCLEFRFALVSCHRLYGKILDNKTFLKSALNSKATLRFEYSFAVEFPNENCCPLLDIYYTPKEYVELECFTDVANHERVRHRNSMHFLSPTDNTGNAPDQSQITCSSGHNVTKCTGKYILQDYEPKMRWFLLGYLCEDLVHNSLTLKGLKYDINVTQESNITTCQKIDTPTDAAERCSKYFMYVTFPNVFADYTQLQASTTFDGVVGPLLNSDKQKCHLYLEHTLCMVIFPPCKNISVIDSRMTTSDLGFVCSEACQDFVDGCGPYLGKAFERSTRCWYFRSAKNSSKCYYEPVYCNTPKQMENGYHTIIKGNETFSHGTVIKYFCYAGFNLNGPENSTCMLSGRWSSESFCTSAKFANSDSSLDISHVIIYIILPGLILFIVLSTCTMFTKKIRKVEKKPLKKGHLSKRNKKFDAFISYYSSGDSSDNKFVKNQLHPKLESEHSIPFKLCIHDRDFAAGTLILTNIMNAIKNSNSAIAVLSQNYVKSRWCKEEFEECVEESRKDSRFELFVILMDPEEKITGLTDYMEQYMRNKTYLKMSDPALWEKIITSLSKIRTDEYYEREESTFV